jgi:hypothetical protein
MRPCLRCNSLGFITSFTDSEHGKIEVCPECHGNKGFLDPAKDRTRLGVCKFCSQEIYFPSSDIPCILGRTVHVIAPTFNPAPAGEAKTNG